MLQRPIVIEPKYLDERQVYRLTGIKIQTLRNWRANNKGPAFIKPGNGRIVRYRYDDVINFMEGK